MKKVIITGGAGFIGSHLVDTLLGQGHSVTVADSFLTGRYINLSHADQHQAITVVQQDMSSPNAPDHLPGPFDQVYNLACPASPRG